MPVDRPRFELLVAFHNESDVHPRHHPGLVATFDDDFSVLEGVEVVP